MKLSFKFTWNNFRNTFEHKISSNLHKNREEFAELTKTVLRKSVFDDGRCEKDWNEGWEMMKQNGFYELDYFGDLFIVGKYSVTT